MIPEDQPHYEVVHYYRRRHSRRFRSEQDARDYIKLRARTETPDCYSVIWKNRDWENGEQVTVYDGDGTELHT